MAAFTREEIQAEIAALKVQLGEIAVSLRKAREVQQYSLDTGQTRQMVMRQQVSQLQRSRQAILDEIRWWESLLDGEGRGSAHNARPGW